ncbi:serine/threonine-protein kinase [Nonomuraea sp. NPDC046570]|uniref:serine/threonine-protein kinase n=1 Tax=Nonomuraea sp. NPDC046570 TaxID=3155255 RepID=UPI0033F6BEB0
MASSDGEPLGPYRLLSPLGSGGFGEVHLALDHEGRTVAVKVLHPHVAADAGALTRLAREVETMRRVEGAHVAEVLDASLDGPRPYVVTRYVQGRPLSVLPVPVDDLLRLARGLAEALLAMHAAGVVHRDLKPANVMMAEGEPVVIDFGIASAFDSLSVTASGAVIGTPGYLAPEVLEGHAAGVEADVFSFATTLAYAATGRQPYGRGPLSAVAYRVVHHEPDLDGVPEWLEPLLRACMRRDPSARPTAAQIRTTLDTAPPSGTAPAAVGSGVVPVSSPRRRFGRGRSAHSAHPGRGVDESVAGPGRGVDELPVSSLRGGDEVPAGSYRGVDEPVVGAARGVVEPPGGGVHDLATREWRLGRGRRPGTLEEVRARHREKIRRRWIIGSGVFVALLAAAARAPLPEVSLLLLVGYGIGLLSDAGVAVYSRSLVRRGRLITDAAAGAGVVALWLVLSTMLSPFTLALFAGTVLVAGVIFLLSA